MNYVLVVSWAVDFPELEWPTVRFDSMPEVITYVEDHCTGMSISSWWVTFTPSCFWRLAKSCFRLAEERACKSYVNQKCTQQLTSTFMHIAHTSPISSRSKPRLDKRLASGSAGFKWQDLLWADIKACVARLMICARHLKYVVTHCQYVHFTTEIPTCRM